jgi:hypothetical protein
MTAANVTPIRPRKADAKPAKRRKGKRPAAWPSRCNWPTPEPLRPIPWGKPDRILGFMVCRSVERSMPATPWQWEARRAYLPAFLGWIIVAALLAALLAGASRV